MWDVAALSAQTLDSMQMLLSAYEVNALRIYKCSLELKLFESNNAIPLGIINLLAFCILYEHALINCLGLGVMAYYSTVIMGSINLVVTVNYQIPIETLIPHQYLRSLNPTCMDY